MTSKNQVNGNVSTEELTPQQKAALTRKLNKEKKEAEERAKAEAQATLDLEHKEEFAKEEAAQEEAAMLAKEEAKADMEDVKPEPTPEPTPQPEVKKDNLQPAEWFLNDISSPSHERFALKQGSKRMVELSPKDIKELGLAFDPEKFATRNNYIEVTKHKLVQLIKEGKFNSPKAIAKWAAPDSKFPPVEPIKPTPKKPKVTEDKPDLEGLNFLEDTVNF